MYLLKVKNRVSCILYNYYYNNNDSFTLYFKVMKLHCDGVTTNYTMLWLGLGSGLGYL